MFIEHMAAEQGRRVSWFFRKNVHTYIYTYTYTYTYICTDIYIYIHTLTSRNVFLERTRHSQI